MTDERTAHDDDHEAASLQIVCFQVGDQRYGLDIMRVKEVAFPTPVIAVPGAPGFVSGIVAIHGVYVPLIDLRPRFGVPAVPGGRLLLVALDRLIVALAVDRVLDTRAVPSGALAAPPPLAGTAHVAGVLEGEDAIVLVLDLEALLEPAERRQLRSLGEGA